MQLDNSQTEIKPKPQTKLSSFHKKFIIILSASTIVLIFT